MSLAQSSSWGQRTSWRSRKCLVRSSRPSAWVGWSPSQSHQETSAHWSWAMRSGAWWNARSRNSSARSSNARVRHSSSRSAPRLGRKRPLHHSRSGRAACVGRVGNTRRELPCTRASQILTLRLGRCCCRKVARRRVALSQLPPQTLIRQFQMVEYRVLLLRRLRLPLSLAPKHCACGGLPDELGDHRSACAQVGALARRAGLLERAAARICKGAGARVATNVALRELNLDVPAADGRRIEVVANGLPFWQGAQIAIDATIVSPVRRDGSARPEADSEPGLALARVLNRKHRTYPELQRARRCQLVVFGVKLRGRINRSTLTFRRLLGRAKARQRAP